MLKNLIDFFFPHFCPVCGEVDELLCKRCERELGIATQICPICEQESLMGWTHEKCKKKNGLDGLISLFEYGDPGVRKVIDSIKYDFNKELINRIFENVRLEVGVDFDFVIPVPLHIYRYNWRGFNQAEVIARVLSSQIPATQFESLLIRKINTPQQVKMANRQERQKNVNGVFMIDVRFQTSDPPAGRASLRGKKVLLVDDVFTTGASMGECCRALKGAGVEVVWGFTLAH